MAQLIDEIKRSGGYRTKRHPVKLTALMYLREALLGERYEDCPEFIRIAREFGARPEEVRYLLEDSRRHPAENYNFGGRRGSPVTPGRPGDG